MEILTANSTENSDCTIVTLSVFLCNEIGSFLYEMDEIFPCGADIRKIYMIRNLCFRTILCSVILLYDNYKAKCKPYGVGIGFFTKYDRIDHQEIQH